MNATTAAPLPSSLDREAIHRLRTLARETDPALFSEIMSMFLEDLAKYLAALHSAIAERDVTALEHIAHAMKGASMNIGATGLAGISAKMENAAGAGGLTIISPLLLDLEAEVRRVQADIALELSAAA